MGHWLSHQQQARSEVADQALVLFETWDLDHVKIGEYRVFPSNRFSISESGTIGISCEESPSLSVMYSDTDKPPVILSDRKKHSSATFVKIGGKEYLATARSDDGCLYLSDIELKTSKKVFHLRMSKSQPDKDMNIFKIDDDTIGYGEVYPSPDGSRRVFFLKTGKRQWNISLTLKLFAPKYIWDTCFKYLNGSPCLLLCIPGGNRIMAVEMIGGKTRWEVGKQEMGERFYPTSICTDEDNTVYVTDYWENKIHQLSVEDGSVITSIDLHHFGIACPFTVRVLGQHLYVEHYRNPGDKYAISKFKKEL